MAGKEQFREYKQYVPPVTDSPIAPHLRTIYGKAAPILLKHEVHQAGNGDGIKKAEDFLNNGYGLIIAYTHPSRKETGGIFIIPAQSPVMRERRVVEPHAIHQRQKWIDKVTKHIGVEMHYIITDDTVEYEWEHQQEYAPGTFRDYSERGHLQALAAQRELEVLSEGGIMLAAFQGGRRSELTVPERPALGTFAAEIKKRGMKVAVLPVGVGIRGVTDYENASGYNWTKKYDLWVGEPEDIAKIAEKAGSNRKVDQYITNNMIANLVPEAYLKVFDKESTQDPNP
jgi:hypothetical protein